mmetsp:Transcript_24463/g.76929  ORF Transcript_24463/g.76929 Transcript_24463/m.76929 type:complete len:141 (+) Transcript_24463:109-531(+)
MNAPALIWECTKKNSCMIRKSKNNPTFSAEPGNLCGLHGFKYSSLANGKVLDVRPVVKGKKESIVVITKSHRFTRAFRPKQYMTTTGLKKNSKKGLETLTKLVASTGNRRDLLELAKKKYMKVKMSFKKKAPVKRWKPKK